jgi:hypothetical protein
VREQSGHDRPDALAIAEDDMDKLLLTPTEAATALGIGRSKVYELMQTGSAPVGPHRRLPGVARRGTAHLPRADAHSQLSNATSVHAVHNMQVECANGLWLALFA